MPVLFIWNKQKATKILVSITLRNTHEIIHKLCALKQTCIHIFTHICTNIFWNTIVGCCWILCACCPLDYCVRLKVLATKNGSRVCQANKQKQSLCVRVCIYIIHKQWGSLAVARSQATFCFCQSFVRLAPFLDQPDLFFESSSVFFSLMLLLFPHNLLLVKRWHASCAINCYNLPLFNSSSRQNVSSQYYVCIAFEFCDCKKF